MSRTTPRTLPTMDDVASAAGVSRSLVSLVYRDSPKVSDERRQRVLDAAAVLGYRPNAAARDLAGGAQRTVGVLLNDLHNPFFAGIYDGIELAARELGLRLVLTVSRQRDAGEQAAVETMLQQRVDGMILTSPRLEDSEILAAARVVPVVVVGRQVVGTHCDSVTTDEHVGGRLVIEHLRQLGHRRVTHVDGGRGAGAAARRSGIEAEAVAAGMDVTEVIEGDYTESAGVAAARRMLERPMLPTAVVAANDLAAIGVMAAFDDAGVRVPEDVSLVGYDNTFLAGLRHVALTSVDQSCPEMGRTALTRLHSGFQQPAREAQGLLTTPRLVARRSTASPRSR